MWKITAATKVREDIYDVTATEFEADGVTETGQSVQKRHNNTWGNKILETNLLIEINSSKAKIDENTNMTASFEAGTNLSIVPVIGGK